MIEFEELRLLRLVSAWGKFSCCSLFALIELYQKVLLMMAFVVVVVVFDWSVVIVVMLVMKLREMFLGRCFVLCLSWPCGLLPQVG